MRRKREHRSAPALILAVLALAACHDDATAPVREGDPVQARMYLEPGVLTLEEGQIGRFEAFIHGKAPELEALLLESEWRSDDPEVARIEGDGLFRGMKAGKTIITARGAFGLQAAATVKVVPGGDSEEPEGKEEPEH